jgi:hypothetical protein
MLKLSKTIVGIFLGFLLYECGYPCGKASSFIGLISFTDAESDTIIFRRFSKGTNFAALRDTFILARVNGNFQRNNDTVLILHSIDGNRSITSDFDYEVFLPKVSILYRLKEIKEELESGRGKGPYCINPITAYRLNGEFFSGDRRYDFIYLKK